ncbi:MAG TPA: BrnT family toxin [Bryobacteraceae bacterium]|jgi:uncharacterized DUF497 family protein|nr:BrnT family toxin [Bryobacteraceae bacterium]
MLHFEWDERKNGANEKKHGVDFETAQLVFDDPFCVTCVERITDAEQRWHAISAVENLIVLVVVHTYRGEAIRIISARPASSYERRLYAEAAG